MARTLIYDIPGPDWAVTPGEVRELGWAALFSGAFVRDRLERPGSRAGFARIRRRRAESPDDVRHHERPIGPAPPLHVEIGYGRGEFITEMARRDPSAAFLGIEVSYKRALKMRRRLAPTDIRNLRLIESDAETVVRELLPAASVKTCWINFPDPWPKARHADRRVVRPIVVRHIAECLAPGGALRVATDDPEYAQQVDDVLTQSPLENAYAPDPFRKEVEGRVDTAYELEWRAQGRSFHFFDYRSASAAPVAAGDARS